MAPEIDASYHVLAARYFRKQAKQLRGQLDGIRRAEDIEPVHRARVASRRLRAAMQMFGNCFDARDLKRWRKRIRRVTNDLGEARDKDVQIEYLCEALESIERPACFPGVTRLTARLQRRRDRLQPAVVKAVERLQASEVLGEILSAAKKVLSKSNAESVDLAGPFALTETRRHILRRLDEMLAHQDSLADAEADQHHHEMRIAAKRLRYTLEISGPVYGGQLDETIVAIKRVQSLLGEIHDCDVWLQQLEAYAKGQRQRIVKHYGNAGPFAGVQVGIEYLRQQRRSQRERAFGQLVDFWQELEQRKTWEALAATVGSDGQRPAESQPLESEPPESQLSATRSADAGRKVVARSGTADDHAPRDNPTREPHPPATKQLESR